MELARITRNLQDELHSAGPRPLGAQGSLAGDRQRAAMPKCALTAGASCSGGCGGSGYLVGRAGPYAHGTVCSCVTTCAVCFGRARMVDSNGVSKPCRTPSPVSVVNRLNDAQIPARFADATLDSYSNFAGNGRDILQRLVRFAKDFRAEDGRGMLISGGVGVGKTYLLSGLARILCAQGVSVKFVDFFQLLGVLRAAYSQDKSDLSILNPLLDVDVLIIDELGKGRNTDWELTILDQLVMGRYNQRKPIVASTNCPITGKKSLQGSYNFDLEQMQRMGGFAPTQFEHLESIVGMRIYSRLIEMCEFAELTGDDVRRRAVAPAASASSPRGPTSPQQP